MKVLLDSTKFAVLLLPFEPIPYKTYKRPDLKTWAANTRGRASPPFCKVKQNGIFSYYSRNIEEKKLANLLYCIFSKSFQVKNTHEITKTIETSNYQKPTKRSKGLGNLIWTQYVNTPEISLLKNADEKMKNSINMCYSNYYLTWYFICTRPY